MFSIITTGADGWIGASVRIVRCVRVLWWRARICGRLRTVADGHRACADARADALSRGRTLRTLDVLLLSTRANSDDALAVVASALKGHV
jgi:hypothetical protein